MSQHEEFQSEWLRRYARILDIPTDTDVATAVKQLVDLGCLELAVELLFGRDPNEIITMLRETDRPFAGLESVMYLDLLEGKHPDLVKKIADDHEWIGEFKLGWFIQTHSDPIEVLWVGDPLAKEIYGTFLTE